MENIVVLTLRTVRHQSAVSVRFAFVLARAKKEFEENLATCFNFDDFCNQLEKKKVILAPFCGSIPCEEKIKKLSAR